MEIGLIKGTGWKISDELLSESIQTTDIHEVINLLCENKTIKEIQVVTNRENKIKEGLIITFY